MPGEKRYTTALVLVFICTLCTLLLAAVVTAQDVNVTGDGRINDFNALDPAIYCRDGGVWVWAINPFTGNGELSLRSGGGQIEATAIGAIVTAQNGFVLVRSGQTQLEVSGPEGFFFRFDYDMGFCEFDRTAILPPAPGAEDAAAAPSMTEGEDSPETTQPQQIIVVTPTPQVTPVPPSPTPFPPPDLGVTSPVVGADEIVVEQVTTISVPPPGFVSPRVPPLSGPYPLISIPLDESALGRLELYGIVGAEKLYLRSGDSVRYIPVAVLDFRTPVLVLGRNANRTWWFVETGGFRGWVNAEFLLIRGDATRVPIVRVGNGRIEPPRAFIDFPNNAVYSRPEAVRSAFVCRIPGGLEHLIVGQREGGEWYQIQTICNDGTPVTAWIQVENIVIRNFGEVSIPVTVR